MEEYDAPPPVSGACQRLAVAQPLLLQILALLVEAVLEQLLLERNLTKVSKPPST